MYDAIKLLKELQSALESRLKFIVRGSSEYILIQDNIVVLKIAIERIEKDLAKIQEGSYIF